MGLVVDGHVVTEATVAPGQVVTVGTEAECSLRCDGAGLPARLLLLRPSSGGWRLVLGGQVGGRLLAGGASVDVDALVAIGAGTRRGRTREIPIGEDVRGRLRVGDATVLFHLVPAPEPIAQPSLPPGLRRHPVRDEWRFAALLAGIFALHLGGAYVLAHTPLPVEATVATISGRFLRIIQSLPHVAPPKPVARPTRVRAAPESRPAEIATRARHRARATLAGTGLSGAASLVNDILGTSGLGITDALEHLGSDAPATPGAPSLPGTVRLGAHGLAGLGPLETGGAGTLGTTGKRSSLTLPGKVAPGIPYPKAPGISPAVLARFIHDRLDAVTGCYEAAMKRDHSLHGKIVVRFVIGMSGDVTAVSAETDTVGSAEVRACVRRRIRTWRFPVSPPHPVPVSVPFVFTPVQ